MRNRVAYTVKSEDGPKKIYLAKICYVRAVANNFVFTFDRTQF